MKTIVIFYILATLGLAAIPPKFSRCVLGRCSNRMLNPSRRVPFTAIRTLQDFKAESFADPPHSQYSSNIFIKPSFHYRFSVRPFASIEMHGPDGVRQLFVPCGSTFKTFFHEWDQILSIVGKKSGQALKVNITDEVCYVANGDTLVIYIRKQLMNLLTLFLFHILEASFLKRFRTCARITQFTDGICFRPRMRYRMTRFVPIESLHETVHAPSTNEFHYLPMGLQNYIDTFYITVHAEYGYNRRDYPKIACRSTFGEIKDRLCIDFQIPICQSSTLTTEVQEGVFVPVFNENISICTTRNAGPLKIKLVA